MKKCLRASIDLYRRGIRTFADKWNVLAPHKYTIAIENHKSEDYISEKLTECFLSYTFPLYYGCTNVEDYHPKRCFERLDITDCDGSLELIGKITSDTDYDQKHLSALCEAKKRYLKEYCPYQAVTHIINELEKNPYNQPKNRNLLR